MTQPTDTEEAIGLAQRWLERYLPGELEAQARGPIRDFSGGVLKAWRTGMLTPDGTIDQDKMDDLIAAAAAGNKQAFSQVASIAIWLLQTGHPLPDTFRELEISLWREKLPKLKLPRNVVRDIQYGMVIYILQEHGFNPTRNRASHGETDAPESGCSILSKALAGMGEHIPERTLEGIWEKYSHLR